METKEFIKQLKEAIEETQFGTNDYFVAGDDMSINTSLTVDPDGYLWFLDGSFYENFNRIKTNINVKDIIEIRKNPSEVYFTCFWVICNDNTGLCFDPERDEVYYCKDGAILEDGNKRCCKVQAYFKANPVD